jgi:hypothetical protein
MLELLMRKTYGFMVSSNSNVMRAQWVLHWSDQYRGSWGWHGNGKTEMNGSSREGKWRFEVALDPKRGVDWRFESRSRHCPEVSLKHLSPFIIAIAIPNTNPITIPNPNPNRISSPFLFSYLSLLSLRLLLNYFHSFQILISNKFDAINI